MKSVGESMAIGRTFKEAFQKGIARTGIGAHRLDHRCARRLDDRLPDESIEALRGALSQPTPERVFQIKRAMRAGFSRR
jgi:carbamoyl-phosphate synthase large subunit